MSPQRDMPRAVKVCQSENVLPVSQPDMTLSDQELFGDDHPHDHRVVSSGGWARMFRLTYFSYALQHRGPTECWQQLNGKQILVYKDQGLVSTEQTLQGLRGLSRWDTCATRRPARTCGATPSRRWVPPHGTLALAHKRQPDKHG